MATDFFEEYRETTDVAHRFRDRMVIISKFGLPAPATTLSEIIGFMVAGWFWPKHGKPRAPPRGL